MVFQVGEQAFVRYNVRGPRLYHVRLVVGHVVDEVYVIYTPDDDLYVEDFGSADFLEVGKHTVAGRAPLVSLTHNSLYDFSAPLSALAMAKALTDGLLESRIERLRRGLPPDAPVVGGVGVPGALIAPVAAPIAAGPAGAIVRRGPLAGLHVPGGAVGDIAAGLGLAGRAAALGPGEPMLVPGGPPPVVPVGAGAGVVAAGAAALGAAAAQDARALPVEYDETDARHRGFRSATLHLYEHLWRDWAVPGRRITRWVIKKESVVMKERRRARNERGLQRPPAAS
jgi:hypothetical protein